MIRSADARALDAIRRLVRALEDATRDAGRTAGVTAAQRFVLELLADSPAPTINALAERTHTTQATVVVAVNRLERRGLVVRAPDPADRRRTTVTLTRAGHRLIARSSVPVQVHLIAALHALPARRVQALATTLEDWLAKAGLGHIPATLFLEPRDKNNGGRRA
ncbi:MAG TPA: MarR family transcriptional regulator [Gemmatimonadales bacterium]|jgi:DNA-binding MarR family transcriptional regulator